MFMCADKRLPSAISSCCGGYSDRDPPSNLDWADVLCEYRGERLTFEDNSRRCADWGRSTCDPRRIGAFTGHRGQCVHRQCCRDTVQSVAHPQDSTYAWTNAPCSVRVVINPHGLIAVVHHAEHSHNQWGDPVAQSHVNKASSVSYFDVQWDTTNVAVGKLEYPHVDDNACDGGEVFESLSCLCDTTLEETAVFGSLPTREQVLAQLQVGAFDPVMYDDNTYTTLVEVNTADGVSAYAKVGVTDYSIETVFRVKKNHSDEYIFFQNMLSTVKVCNGNFFFRNAPSFFDIVGKL